MLPPLNRDHQKAARQGFLVFARSGAAARR